MAYAGTNMVHMGNGSNLQITHIGSSQFFISDYELQLNNINWLILSKNILSISQLQKDNVVTVKFIGLHCFVKDQVTYQTLLHGSIHEGIYQLHLPKQAHYALQATSTSLDVLHKRIVHCSHGFS
jgi:hypothetical protein